MKSLICQLLSHRVSPSFSASVTFLQQINCLTFEVCSGAKALLSFLEHIKQSTLNEIKLLQSLYTHWAQNRAFWADLSRAHLHSVAKQAPVEHHRKKKFLRH